MFEWDPRKAEANAAKHSVSFEDAVSVFLDPEALDGPDLQHSSAESRFLRLGRSAGGHVLVLDQFRKEARRRRVGYQTLINEVLARHVRKDVA